jgi:exodeoxyribonuclease-3
MKIVSYNVNGIRAAINKGFFEWLKQADPDVVCLQETKAHESQLELAMFEDAGYVYNYWLSAEKKGYSGVAILSKVKPIHVEFGTGIDYMDFEGRNIRADFDGLSVMSLYLPSGTNDARLGFKFKYMDDFLEYSKDLRKEIPNLIISGDYNICHKAIDIHDPIRNARVSGFLPEEREWLGRFIDSGFVDSFREFNQNPHNYTWWSYRANSRNNNKGWRIDYHMVTQPLQEKLKRAVILPEARHSDHCPLMVEIER